MIVVGDSYSDQPINMPGVVFIHYEKCARYPTTTLEEIFDSLINQGKGSFSRGFDILDQLRLSQGAELTTLDSSVTFKQEQRGKDTRPLKEGRYTPTIYQISAPS